MVLAHSAEGKGWSTIIEPWEFHSALAHFPISLLLSGVALDLYAEWKGNPNLLSPVRGLLITGVLTGIVVALASVLAFSRSRLAAKRHTI